MIAVLVAQPMEIRSADDVVLVRRKVRQMAQNRHLDAFAIAAVTTAVSELTRNVWVHAGGGHALLEELTDGVRYGVRATFTDAGPGIPELERVLIGGYSTTRTMGLGLSGSKRLVDHFEIDTKLGLGTTIKIEKWQSPR